MSTIYTVDWTSFLAPDSDLPTDVTFNVIQSSGSYRVKAHRLILAAVSPVFRRMFFANNENNFTTETEAIDITDSECFAFQKMINFIYSKDYTFLLHGDITDSFETLKVGDKYDLTDLVILSRRAIENYIITSKNVGKVLKVIDSYKTLEGFDVIAEELYMRCQTFIEETMRTAQDVFNLLAVSSEEEDETELIVALLRETARCRSCKMHPTQCLHGQKVTYDNMIEGEKQRIRANSTFQSLSNWTTLENTIGHISAFSMEDSVHYYTPGGMALRYCYKFGVKWNNTGWLGTKEPLIEAHYLDIPDVSYYCEELE